MDILISVSKQDLKCDFMGKSLIEYVVKSLVKFHKVYVHAQNATISEIEGAEIVQAKDEIAALKDFLSVRESVIFINRLALCDINFENLIKYHENHGKNITAVSKNFVKGKSIPIYRLNDKKEITSVTQKRFADCGIYLINNAVSLDNVANALALIKQEIKSREVRGFVHKGYWWTTSNIRRRGNGKSFKCE